VSENSNQKPDQEQQHSKTAIDDYGQYHVENPFEMCSILKGLMTKPDVITAYYDIGMTHFILTSVISVNTKNRTFILDISSDAERNDTFAKSERITCKTKCNNVLVEFTIRKLKAIKYNDEYAFLCDLPNNILYLQRRDFYRMEIPRGDKIKCRIQGETNDLVLSDISSGGIGLNEPNLSLTHDLFERWHHCEIDLGEIGTISFDLELRNKQTVKIKNNKEVIRLGYKFLDLSTPDNAKIQRYIHNIDMRKKQSK